MDKMPVFLPPPGEVERIAYTTAWLAEYNRRKRNEKHPPVWKSHDNAANWFAGAFYWRLGT